MICVKVIMRISISLSWVAARSKRHDDFDELVNILDLDSDTSLMPAVNHECLLAFDDDFILSVSGKVLKFEQVRYWQLRNHLQRSCFSNFVE